LRVQYDQYSTGLLEEIWGRVNDFVCAVDVTHIFQPVSGFFSSAELPIALSPLKNSPSILSLSEFSGLYILATSPSTLDSNSTGKIRQKKLRFVGSDVNKLNLCCEMRQRYAYAPFS
jgi:hypothetical protein